VHQHLDETITLTIGAHRVGHYSGQGKLLTPLTKKQAKAVEKTPLRLLDDLANRTLHLLRKADISRFFVTFDEPCLSLFLTEETQ
jgi:hypothetical protein